MATVGPVGWEKQFFAGDKTGHHRGVFGIRGNRAARADKLWGADAEFPGEEAECHGGKRGLNFKREILMRNQIAEEMGRYPHQKRGKRTPRQPT